MLQPEYPAPIQSIGRISEAIPSPSETFQSLRAFVRRQYLVLSVTVAMQARPKFF